MGFPCLKIEISEKKAAHNVSKSRGRLLNIIGEAVSN
jgi:hypothetical protein